MKNTQTAIFVIILALCSLINSCSPVFDTPPLQKIETVLSNTTIRDLKKQHEKGFFEKIEDDKIVSGIVIANDQSGSFYKQIIVQDSTGGIVIKIDDYNLAASYPIGMHLTLKCKGLTMGDYHGLIEIGGSIDYTDPYNPMLGGISKNVCNSFIVRGSLNNEIVPKIVTPSMLSTNMQDALQSTLICLTDMEFAVEDTGKTYADPTKAVSGFTYTLSNCEERSISLRNSSYADFAGVILPKGNGMITGIYSVYENSGQINIRDTSDVQFNNIRCSIFEEQFETCIKESEIIPGWKNITQSGNIIFTGNIVSSNGFVEISGRGLSGDRPELSCWLISKAIQIPTAITPKFSIETIDGYDTQATLQALISDTYQPENDPASGQWKNLDAIISSGTTSGYAKDFLNSGNIDLTDYAGKTVYLALKYQGASPAKGSKRTTVFRVDNISIRR